MIENKKRIQYIDALKGFTIFCVLWGHSLQYLKNDYDFFHNSMFEFIYSFHMPLFFMISGFFFRSSLKLNYKEFLHKKSVQLLLPCLVWAMLYFMINFSVAIMKGDEHFMNNWFGELKIELLPNHWIWFLRDLFLSYLIVYTSIKLLKRKSLACFLSISFILFAPYCGIQRFLLPMFWAGVYLKDNYQIISKYAKETLIISGIIFTICLLFWDGNYTTYVTNFSNLLALNPLGFNFANIDISIFRLIIGLFGSVFWFMLFEIIYKNNILFISLGTIGVNTLAIYLLQRPILEIFINRLIDFPNMNIWIYNTIVTPFVSLGTLIICLFIIKILKKNKYAELLLFGKKR